MSNPIDELSVLLQRNSVSGRESVIERIKKICKAKTQIIDSLDILQSLFERNASLVTYTSGLILQARFFLEADLALNECLSRKIADADIVCKRVESKGKHLLDHKARTHPCPADYGRFTKRYKEITVDANDERRYNKAHAKVVACWQPQIGSFCGLHSVHVVLCALSKQNAGAEDTRNKYTLGGMLDNLDKEICQNVPYAREMPREDRGMMFGNNLDLSGLNRETIQFALTNNLNEEEFEVTAVENPSQASQPFGNTVAIIAGTGIHWLAFVKVDGFWFNADSMNSPFSPLLRISEGGVHDYLKQKTLLHFRVVQRDNVVGDGVADSVEASVATFFGENYIAQQMLSWDKYLLFDILPKEMKLRLLNIKRTNTKNLFQAIAACRLSETNADENLGLEDILGKYRKTLQGRINEKVPAYQQNIQLAASFFQKNIMLITSKSAERFYKDAFDGFDKDYRKVPYYQFDWYLVQEGTSDSGFSGFSSTLALILASSVESS
jgi:hypothetical protein